MVRDSDVHSYKLLDASLMSRSTAPTNQIYAAMHINPFVTQEHAVTKRNRIHRNISSNIYSNTASTSAVVESPGFRGLDNLISVPTSIPFPEFLSLRDFWLLWRFLNILGYGTRMTWWGSGRNNRSIFEGTHLHSYICLSELRKTMKPLSRERFQHCTTEKEAGPRLRSWALPYLSPWRFSVPYPFGYLPSHILHTRSLPKILKLQAGSNVLAYYIFYGTCEFPSGVEFVPIQV
jgi:hypothetical protein